MMCGTGVDAAVAGAGEPVALLVAAGCVQRRGPVPGGEAAWAGEAADVGDVAQQPCGTRGSDPVELQLAAAGGLDQLGQGMVGVLDLLVHDGELGH
jgi:hypothetical protein